MTPTIRLVSTGKNAVLSGQINADCYIDCRVIKNPYRDPVLGGKTGDDPVVQSWIVKENFPFLRAVLTMIKSGVQTAPTRNSFKGDSSKPFTVAFFCLAGVHRSRGTKNVIAQLIKSDKDLSGYQVEVVK